MKIGIDAGHGGHDSGAVGSGALEKNEALAMAMELNRIAKGRGHNTILTRDNDTFIELRHRANIANHNGCDVFVSLHMNSGGTGATGIETLAAVNASKTSVNLASAVSKAIVGITGLPLRRGNGVWRKDVTVVKATRMPAILVEVGFISNANDLAVTRAKRTEILTAIIQETEKAFGAKPTNPEQPAPEQIDGVERKQYIVTARELNLRLGDGTSSKVLRTLKKGTKLGLDSYYAGDQWARVVTEDGLMGYVFMEYIQPESIEDISDDGRIKRSVTAGVVNMRSKPSTKGNTPILQLRRGDVVGLDSYYAGEDWARVAAYNTGELVLGYVWAAYIGLK